MCREKCLTSSSSQQRLGSPLHVQGKGTDVRVGDYIVRITPACAGKSKVACHGSGVSKDHPCVCREKGSHLHYEIRPEGSPLRVQGKALVNLTENVSNRITPACAGKRKAIRFHTHNPQDHPCVCREK